MNSAKLIDFITAARNLGWDDSFTLDQILMVAEGIRDGRLHDLCIMIIV